MATVRPGSGPGMSDPARNFKFQVQFHHNDKTISDNIGLMGFMSVSGLAVSTEAIPYREGGMNTTPHKSPGQSDYAPVTLVNGVFGNKFGFWYWQKMMNFYQAGAGLLDNAGSIAGNFRSDVEITVFRHPVTNDPLVGANLGNSGQELRYMLYNAWPTGYALSDLNAGDNSVLVQQVTLVYEGFDMKWGDGTSQSFPQ